MKSENAKTVKAEIIFPYVALSDTGINSIAGNEFEAVTINAIRAIAIYKPHFALFNCTRDSERQKKAIRIAET